SRGTLIYKIKAEGRLFHFIAVSRGASGVERAGRARDNEFDFYGQLHDGTVELSEMLAKISHMTANVWEGRAENTCLGWSLANRSNRCFDHTVDRLAASLQPDRAFLATGGSYI